MKNIHVLPTEKPSRLHLNNSGLVLCDFNFGKNTINGQHIYITNDEEIKEGDYCISHLNIIDEGKIHNSQTIFNPKTKEDLIALQSCKKIILTTDQDLNGVQAIDDDFLEWFVKNPSCESVEVDSKMIIEYEPLGHAGGVLSYKIIIPQEEPKHPKVLSENGNELFFDEQGNLIKEEPKQETLEEAAERFAETYFNKDETSMRTSTLSFKDGAKWQQEQDNKELAMWKLAVEKQEARCTALRGVISDLQDKNKYSEEEVLDMLKFFTKNTRGDKPWVDADDEWFEQFKKK
jgi:hypothetical protein